MASTPNVPPKAVCVLAQDPSCAKAVPSWCYQSTPTATCAQRILVNDPPTGGLLLACPVGIIAE